MEVQWKMDVSKVVVCWLPWSLGSLMHRTGALDMFWRQHVPIATQETVYPIGFIVRSRTFAWAFVHSHYWTCYLLKLYFYGILCSSRDSTRLKKVQLCVRSISRWTHCSYYPANSCCILVLPGNSIILLWRRGALYCFSIKEHLHSTSIESVNFLLVAVQCKLKLYFI